MPSYARRTANVERARLLGQRWRMTLQFVVQTLAAIVVMVLVGHWLPAVPTQFCVGAVLGACGMVLALAVAGFDNARVRGHMAEQFTAALFKKQRRWTAFHNLSFGKVDVDSVVVTPRAVVAVETKWRHRTRDVDSERRRQDDLVLTAERARKVRLLLTQTHKLDVDVIPMLIVWGSGAPDLPAGHRVTDDVWEVDGHDPDSWTRHFATGRLEPATATAVLAAMAEHQGRRDTYDRQTASSMRSDVWAAFRAGVTRDREQRATRRTARQTPTALTE